MLHRDRHHETSSPTRDLCRFAAELSFEALPPAVVATTKNLMVDWLGSALAGRGHPAVAALEAFGAAMGPPAGSSTILTSGRGTSPFFAALANGASSHVVEQDDVHNGSVFHPGAVVFPSVVAVAEAEGISGKRMIEAAVAGYEVGIRVGEALGRTHYEVFHTTGTAGTLAAAAAVGKVLGLGADRMNHALGTAGTQAAGLWEFLRDAADSKQVHAAKAAADGLLAAFLARDGVTGAELIVVGARGLPAGMTRDGDPSLLTAGLGSRWAILEVSYKWHASCRHTHPAADALDQVLRRERLAPDDVAKVTAHVHKGAIDVLGAEPTTIHQSKFSMGTVLGLIAIRGSAGLDDFDEHALLAPVGGFAQRVSMALDAEVDAAYPRKWIGKVTVETTDGRRFSGRVDEPKGDPGNALSDGEIRSKARRLAIYRESAAPSEIDRWIEGIDRLEERESFSGFFSVPDGIL